MMSLPTYAAYFLSFVGGAHLGEHLGGNETSAFVGAVSGVFLTSMVHGAIELYRSRRLPEPSVQPSQPAPKPVYVSDDEDRDENGCGGGMSRYSGFGSGF